MSRHPTHPLQPARAVVSGTAWIARLTDLLAGIDAYFTAEAAAPAPVPDLDALTQMYAYHDMAEMPAAPAGAAARAG
ncbi:MAG: hypothetical protein IE927_08760 [Rhodobacterales bacterium]|nr:hypothetical protein [Rhodobacterales bacterium]